jgi:hypothetical protein
VYARKVKGKTLTLSVSGMLWNRSLVILDAETKSLWSHILGRAMQGPLEGETLDVLPGLMTDWKFWLKNHPDTTVAYLSRTSKNYRREFYRDPSKFLVGIAEGDTVRAWPFDQLLKQPVVNDRFDDRAMLIAFDKISSTAYLYDRNLGGVELQFTRKNEKLLDTATKSEWNIATGKALSGSMKGKQLKPVPGVVSYRRAWENFHPETKYWSAK